MNKLLLILLSILVLSSCCKDPIIKREIVKVPFVVYKDPPTPALVSKSKLPIDELTENSTNEDKARAIVETIAIMKSDIKALEESLKPFQE